MQETTHTHTTIGHNQGAAMTCEMTLTSNNCMRRLPHSQMTQPRTTPYQRGFWVLRPLPQTTLVMQRQLQLA